MRLLTGVEMNEINESVRLNFQVVYHLHGLYVSQKPSVSRRLGSWAKSNLRTTKRLFAGETPSTTREINLEQHKQRGRE
jgi:hypothetical protein